MLNDARNEKERTYTSYAKYLYTEKSKNIDSCFKVNHVHVFTLIGLIMKEKKVGPCC